MNLVSRLFAGIIGLCLVVSPCSATGEVTLESAALDRLLAAVEAAVDSSPMARERLHTIEAERAHAAADGAADPPYVEWQREGIGPSFSRRDNAADYLRLGRPFSLPGQLKAARGLTRAAEASAGAGREAARRSAAADGALRWLRLSAAEERLAVVRDRLERLDRTLAIEEARFQLGEVAGTQVMQLNLEHVRETSLLHTLRAQRVARLEEARAVCGEGVPPPQHGDLEALVAVYRPAGAAAVTVEAVESGALYRSVAEDGAAKIAGMRLDSVTAFGRPEAQVEWQRFPTLHGVPGFDALGLTVSLPLPVGRAGLSRRAAARAEALAVEAWLEGERLGLVQRALSASAAVEAARARLAVLVDVLRDVGRIEHSLAEQFRLGAISYLAYIDGLSRIDEVRLEAIDARLALLEAWVELTWLLDDEGVLGARFHGEEGR